MVLNDAGKMVEKWYFELAHKFPDIKCGEYVIMPNHFHAIILNVGADLRVCPDQNANNTHDMNTIQNGKNNKGEHIGSPLLQKIMQWFKTMTTNEYLRGVKHYNWPAFHGSLWQRNYWDHIIRNEIDLSRIREYIVNNPLQWELDNENP